MNNKDKIHESYIDDYGNTRRFTHVDHDVKTRKSMSKILTEEEINDLKRELREQCERKVNEILCFPAVNAVRGSQDIYETFIKRDISGITWNEDAVRGACMVDPILASNLFNQLWKNTVKEQHWWDDMSYEDIIAGKWKDLT